VLRTAVELQGQEVTGELRNVYNDAFHKLYISLNIIRMIEKRRRGVEHTDVI
jgi:hypothetical protein